MHATAQNQVSARTGPEQNFGQLLKEINHFNQEKLYDSSRQHLLIARKLLSKIKRTDLRVDFYLCSGNYYHYGLQRFDSALVYYYEALNHARQLPQAAKRLEIMERLAYGHYTNADPEPALKWCTRCIELADSLKNIAIQARCMQLLGTLSVAYNQDTTQLIAYRRRALNLCLEARDTASLPRAYHYLALAFYQIGKHHQALVYNDSALLWAAIMQNDQDQTEAKFWQGLSYIELGNYPAALEKLNTVLPYYEQTRDTFRIIHTNHEIGKVLLRQQKNQEVLLLLNRLQPFVERKNALFEWSVQYDLYYQTYRQLANYPLALKFYEYYEAIKDSMAEKENFQALAEVEAKYLVRNQAETIESQKSALELRERLGFVYLFGLFLALTLSVALLILYFRIRKARREVSAQRDIVERQKLELEQLDQLKSRFFANVSHELRTPLTLMLGPVSSMVNSGELSIYNTQLARLAQQHGQHLLQLVNEILDLSKMETGKLEVHEVSVSLQPFLLQIVGAFKSYATERGIHLFVDYQAENRLQLLFDADKVTTILNNLLSNALKFTPPHSDGQISVSAVDLDDRIQLSVCDNGRGIHPNDLPHIFDRFYQTKQTGSPLEGGTGIGLALCKEYAALLKGRLFAESPVPGQNSGSVFYLELPLKPDTEQAPLAAGPSVNHPGLAPFPSGIPSGSAETEAPFVLIVEDNPGMREYLMAILSKNYQVEAAENGQVALQRLAQIGAATSSVKSQLPRLIISDIMMPIMDGFQLLKSLKGDARYRHIPVVMLTARADLQDKLHALRIGVDDYLLKPFEEQELLARIKNLLHFSHLRQINPPISADLAGSNTPVNSDSDWLEALERITLRFLTDPQFSLSFLAEQMELSTRQLQRRLKDATGLSANQYIQEIRLQRGRQLLESGDYLIKDAAAEVGFKDANYFSTLYKERFGKLDME